MNRAHRLWRWCLAFVCGAERKRGDRRVLSHRAPRQERKRRRVRRVFLELP
jgi:hypothetical protein